MKRKYITTANKTTLKLYLIWEYGHKRGIEMLNELEPVKGVYKVPDLALGCGYLARDAKNLANRVMMAASYMQGKLKKPLTAYASYKAV